MITNKEKLSFGTDGWRGIVGRDFTLENVARVSAGVARYLQNESVNKKKVIVGYDTRFRGSFFAQKAADVFACHGFSVVLTREASPTPAAAYYVAKEKLRGGVVITASHNPKEFNGIKFKPSFGGSASSAVTRQIEKEISHVKDKDVTHFLNGTQNRNRVSVADVLPVYANQLLSLVDEKKIRSAKLSAVIDPMHGSGRIIYGDILKRCGVRGVSIHADNDPLLGGVQPEPLEKNLAGLKHSVKYHKADLGLALDGDADRIGAFDEKGNFLDSHHCFALLLYYFLEVKKLRGGVVETLNTTAMIPKLAEIYRVPFYETPVGFKHICELMRKEDILMGGEESGGIGFRGHIPERDGILSGLFLCEMRAAMKKPVSEIVKELYKKTGGPFYYARRDFHLTQEHKAAILQFLNKKSFSALCGMRVTKHDIYDGHKFTLENGDWLMFRASGTEPLLRVYAESKQRQNLHRLLKSGESIVSQNEQG